MDYKQAGVDIEAGDSLVHWLKQTAPSKWPHQDRLVSGIGGFSALFRADFREMDDPCLVSCTDGVGTKVKLASHFGDYSQVGQDLVAMCVNDMICVGAQPLFFLDYYSTGKLVPDAAKSFLEGVRNACLQSEMALIGGETAEMPGVYQEGDFDCAGFSVGVVDREKALGSHRVNEGDRVLMLESSGFHSNGFSLVRKVYAEDLDENKNHLLEPTRLYVDYILGLIRKSVQLSALANITGGGLDNISRVLPDSLCAKLQPWKVPCQFMQVKERAGLEWGDLLRTLNCGVGMVMILPESSLEAAFKFASSINLAVREIGLIEKRPEQESYGWSLNLDDFEALNPPLVSR